MEEERVTSSGGCFEQLRERVEQLKRQSQDVFFTEYLQQLSQRLIQEKHQIDLLRDELDRNYVLYQRRAGEQGMAQQPVAPVPPVQQAYFSGAIQPAPVLPPTYAAVKKKNKEFAVGIGVFSVVGVLFVLAAFVMLAMNYMNGITKGIGLYAATAAVWAVSECLIRRKNQTLALVFSSLGIAGTYLVTIVNYLYLHNIGMVVSILITAAITVLVLFLSRRRESGILRVVGICSCYLSMLYMPVFVGTLEFLVFVGILFVINLVCILLPIQKQQYAIGMFHMVAVDILTLVFILKNIFPVSRDPGGLYLLTYLISALIIVELILIKISGSRQRILGMIAVYGISAVFHLYCGLTLSWSYRLSPYPLLAIMMVVTVVVSAAGYLVMREQPVKWTQFYLAAGAGFLWYGLAGTDLQSTIALIIIMFATKLLCRHREVWAADAVVTTVLAFAALFSQGTVYGYFMIGALALSVVLLHHWKIYFEIVITATVTIFAGLSIDNELCLSVMIAVLWVCVVLFNNVERFAEKGIMGYNISVLVSVAFLYLSLMLVKYPEHLILYMILTILGVGIILMTMQEKYGLRENWRGLAVSIFLTYMVLAARLPIPLLGSVLMLVVGLISIGAGFYMSDKKVRIYGLVLSLLVCFKITLFDFSGEASLERILLFFAAGVVALAISGIYILLEKNITDN